MSPLKIIACILVYAIIAIDIEIGSHQLIYPHAYILGMQYYALVECTQCMQDMVCW